MRSHTDYGMFRSLKSFVGGKVRAETTMAGRSMAGIEARGEADAWALRALGATGFGAPEAALAMVAERGTSDHSS